VVPLNLSEPDEPSSRRLSAHRIALAIPCFDEEARIPALLDALQNLDPAPGLILALDDGSTDRTAELLRAAPGVELLQQGRNLGLGLGRNKLWRTARERGFPIVAFLDADVSPASDHVRHVANLFGNDVRLAGVGGRNVDVLAPDASLADKWRTKFWPQDMGPNPSMDAPMLVGALAAYRTEALYEVTGFDGRFRTNGEDVDVGRRLRAAGWRLRYEPNFVVRHRRRDDPRSLVRACFLHCREGMRATLKTPHESPVASELVVGMARKGARAPASALLKRGDPSEAALGLVACAAGLAGYAAGWINR